MLTILVYILGIGSILVNLFGTRFNAVITGSDLFLYPQGANDQAAVLLGRVTTVCFLLLSLGCIAYSLLIRRFKFPKQGALLVFSGVFLFIMPLVSSLVSKNGGFSYKLLFFPLFLFCVYLMPRISLSRTIPHVLPIFMVFVVISLVSMVFAPGWAYSNYTNSWIGIPIRLQGLSSHPNSLGNISLVLLILLRFLKKKGFWYYFLNLSGLAVIVLSQSKTIWVTLLLWVVLEWLVKTFSSHPQRTTRLLTGVIAFLGLTLTFLVLFYRDWFPIATVTPLSLTGRVDVWQITLETWLEQPLFGYGPNLWNLFFRQDFGFLWAGQAHNQFLQTLGESGLIGLAALLFYLYAYIRSGSLGLVQTHFATFGILMAVVVRSFVESPFRTYSLDEGFLIQAVFVLILINAEFGESRPIQTMSVRGGRMIDHLPSGAEAGRV